MTRGDIDLVSLDPAAGFEHQGHRPALIISPVASNTATQLPVSLSIINGGNSARQTGFALEISGIKTTGLIRCDQPRVLDLAARAGRKVDVLPAA
ncbi:MAG: hypothetical protein RL367_718, partial [Pseudomonadota bacterium]